MCVCKLSLFCYEEEDVNKTIMMKHLYEQIFFICDFNYIVAAVCKSISPKFIFGFFWIICQWCKKI